MSRNVKIALVAIAITAIAFFTCAYTINEDEQVVLLEFGKVKGKEIIRPGLHFKPPWYEARRLDKRWLAWDGDPNQITTLDKRYIRIDVFARWRIVEPIVFVEKLRDEISAQGRLDDILDSATRNVIANHNLIELIRSSNRQFLIPEEEQEFLNQAFAQEAATSIKKKITDETDEVKEMLDEIVEQALSGPNGADTTKKAGQQNDEVQQPSENNTAPSDGENTEPAPKATEINNDASADIPSIYRIQIGRKAITESILARAEESAREMGIEIKDIRLKRIDYIETVQRSVFDRMISERQKVAALLRSQGDGLAAEILGRKDRDLKQIQSEAYKTAEEIKGLADASAARIYAEAYNADPDLYQFLKTLESYRTAIGDKTWLLITTQSEYGQYLKSAR